MNFSKILYCTIVLLISVSFSHSQNRWQFVNPQPTGFNLYKIEKDSSGKMWAFGEYGTIIQSKDEGNSWDVVPINYHNDFYDAAIIDNNMWIVGEKGLILYSNDEGASWKEQQSYTKKSLSRIRFINKNTGWIMASDSLVLRTEDGGINWQKVWINNKWNQNDIIFLNKDVGYLLTGYYNEPNLDITPWTAGAFFRTNDGGLSWTKVDSGNTKYSSIYFLNDRIGFMSVHNNQSGRKLLKTIDAGNSWDTLSHTFAWNKMHFIDESNGIAIGGYFIGRTTDGGVNWEITTEIKTPSNSSRLTSIYSEKEKVLVVGTEGNILRSKDLGFSWNSLKNELPIYYGHLEGVTFVDSLKGFVYGQQWGTFPESNPLLISTYDGGKTWEKKNSPDLFGLVFMKDNNGMLWGAGYKGLYKSSDDWETWTQVPLLKDEGVPRDLVFINSKKIVLLVNNKYYESDDEGESWFSSITFKVQFLKRLVKVNENRWVLLAHEGVTDQCYVTNDAGKSWDLMERKFTDMQFINDRVGYGIDSVIYKTMDGGVTWGVVTSSMKSKTYWTSTLFFYDEKIGWLSSGNFLYYTNDGGNSWYQEFGIKGYPNVPELSSLSIVDKSHVWAVRSNGCIYKLSKSVITAVVQTNSVFPQNFDLLQNYPNPFNPTTTIKFSIPNSQFATLKVYDMLGREVATLVNEEKAPGNYEVKFDGSNLSSGVYFYRLQAGSFSQTKKFVLVK
ncbi:MAG: YCF48-related protein [Bacteroidetes bacterium]|nr:YCF48-related protein [Bacteroidota bacterium]